MARLTDIVMAKTNLVPRLLNLSLGIKRPCMRQLLHTFRVNRNLQDTCPVYVASGTQRQRPQRLNNGGVRYRLWFVVMELSRAFPVSHLLQMHHFCHVLTNVAIIPLFVHANRDDSKLCVKSIVTNLLGSG